MDYPRFVALRRQLWDEFESRLEAARRPREPLGYADLERLAVLFRQILHDHSVAAARYPGTGAASRLHHLALAGTHMLQPDARPSSGGLAKFVTVVFPRHMWRQVPELAVAVSLFAVAALFGLLLGVVQPAVGSRVLGPGRIADLEAGRLWTENLTSAVPPSVSSSMIATNNLSVALTGWVGGAAAGLGALYVDLLNGFMLGSIVAVTVHYGLGGQLLAFIVAHGVLELTLILTCVAAGLRIARAIVVADDRPRAVALREETIGSLLVVLGCLPWFLLLGLVEAFVSPSPVLPVALKITVGIALEVLFLVMAFNPGSREVRRDS